MSWCRGHATSFPEGPHANHGGDRRNPRGAILWRPVRRATLHVHVPILLLVLGGCAAGSDSRVDAGGRPDSGPGTVDAGPAEMDAGPGDTDAGPAEMDAGPEDTDAGPEDTDAGPEDTDAGPEDSDAGPGDTDAGPGGTDAGRPPPIVVDGVVGDAEWAGAASATNASPEEWAGSHVTRLVAAVRDGSLHVGVVGAVADGNAMVVYVDRAVSVAEGVGDLRTLTDSVGALDDALSAGFTTPASFRADMAWGTLDMSRAASGFDARMGWRDITPVGDFAWVEAAEAPTRCSASACETRLPLSTLGGTAPRTIALFARITNSDGLMSPRDTLPMDDPGDSRTVSMLLELAE